MRVATDIGGTFTDLVAIDENGNLILEKAHTTPPNFEAGVMDVMEKSGVDPRGIEAFFHGTTTIINGRLLYRDRQFVDIDEAAVRAFCLEQSQKLWGELNHRAY